MTDLLIRSAYALTPNKFSLALHEHDEENPNSIILRYDATRAAPWLRDDIHSNVNAICEYGPENIVALGNEGEAFFFEGDKSPTKEIIKGAGLEAPHAEGRGFMMDITNAGGTLYAVGYGQQVFKRASEGNWELVESEDINDDVGFGSLHFYIVDAVNELDIYTYGEFVPKRDGKKRARELRYLHEAIDSEDETRIQAARAIYFAPLPEDEGHCYHWDGETWNDVGVPEIVIEACFIETSEKVWIGTADGLLLMGNAEDGFDEVGETDEGIVSICKFGERMIIATRDSLVEFIPNEDSFHGEIQPIKPKLGKKKGNPLPLLVQGFDDRLVYIDYNHGVYIWDGKDEWTHTPIPKELRKR